MSCMQMLLRSFSYIHAKDVPAILYPQIPFPGEEVWIPDVHRANTTATAHGLLGPEEALQYSSAPLGCQDRG